MIKFKYLFLFISELLEDFPEDKWSYLEPGWEYLAKYRDVSDIQWRSWKFLFQILWCYLIFQFFISEMIRVIHKSHLYLKYWYIVSSVIFVVSFMGVKHMIIITVHPFIFLLIIFFGGGKRSIWLISSVLIGVFNLYTRTYKNNVWDFFKYSREEEANLILVCVAWTELRCVSFCVDYIDRKEKLKATKDAKDDVDVNNISTWETIINMLSYIFYLPLLYTGSIILHDVFERSFKVQKYDVTTRLRRFFWDTSLFLLYSFILDLAHHYIYFRGMQYEIEVSPCKIRSFSCGIAIHSFLLGTCRFSFQ